MDFIKKALMVLGVLWLIGFVTMFALGVGVYNVVTSDTVKDAASDAAKLASKAELRHHNEQLNREASASTAYEYESSEYDSEND